MYFLKIDPKGSMCKDNTAGPTTDPCGTSQLTGTEEEQYSLIATEKDLSDRYDLNCDKTVPLKPNNMFVS